MAHTPFIGPDGLEWPSVTQIGDVIAKPGLMKWLGEVGTDEAKKLSDEAKAIGTEAHDELEKYCRDRSYVTTNELAAACVREFCAPYITDIGSIEQKVVNNDFRYHGTFDAIITVKDMPLTKKSKEKYSGIVLTDWKTANGIYDTNGIQLSGYWGAMGDQRPKDGLIVRMDKESKKVYWKLFPDLAYYFEEFKCARSLWDFTNHKGKWSK